VVRVVPYADDRRHQWDEFVRLSKNGTFLFCRDYMEYHRHRFVDASLMFTTDDDVLLAVLPATRIGDVLASHDGLTYGGFVTTDRMGSLLMLQLFDAALSFASSHGIRKIRYKTIPHIYHRVLAEEDRYALFRLGGALVQRDVLSVVRPTRTVAFQKRRIRGIRKAERYGVRIEPSDEFERFWPILEANLAVGHRTAPVHTCAEIRRLQAAFPANIKLYAALVGLDLVAGTVIYETETVAHAQYIAASDAGRAVRALDLLFFHLITVVYKDKPYFDFGISTEDGGRVINEGLVAFKEGFGARAVMHDFYELPTHHAA
jgi:hypothetical protein